MDCREAQELLQDELDGRVAAADAPRLAEHVAGCGACAAEKRGLGELRAAFRSVRVVPAPEGFRDAVVASLPRRRVLRLPWALGALAAVAAGALFAVMLAPGREGGAPAGETATASARNEVADSPRAATAPEPKKQAAGSVAVDEIEAPTGPSTPGAPPALDRAALARKAEESKKSDAGEPKAGEPRPEPAAVPGEKAAGEKPAGDKAGELPKGAIAADTRAPSDPEPLEKVRAPSVRYVVFRDAAAAAAYVRSLAPDPAKGRGAGKTGAPAGGGLAGATAPSSAPAAKAPGRPDAGESKSRDSARDSVAQSGNVAGDQVVGRAALPGGMTDAQFRAAVQMAGGTLATAGESLVRALRADVVPVPAAARPAPPAGSDAGKLASGTGADASAEADKGAPKEKRSKSGGGGGAGGATKSAAGAAEDADEETPPSVTIVVVLLQDPPPAPATPAGLPPK